MRTNIEIDDTLMADVLRITGLKTKRQAVEEGLRTLLRMDAQRRVLELKGIGWEGDLEAMRLD